LVKVAAFFVGVKLSSKVNCALVISQFFRFSTIFPPFFPPFGGGAVKRLTLNY